MITTYTYSTGLHKDRLESVRKVRTATGEILEDFAINSYDGIGNPCNYRGNMLEWNRGRNLVKYNEVLFAYNANGIRQEKTANTVVHKYHLEGSRIHKETYGNNTLWYYYDQSGITGLEYNGSKYYFQKNIQNDVVRIFDEIGILVASYEYDAWGNHKVLNANGFETTETTFIGNINPFRYRGYYYDIETGLYYLNSRYYDPRVGRFINADSIEYLAPESINGLNLYAYCGNDPVNYADPSGHFPIAALLIGIGLGALFGGITAGVSSALAGNTGWALVGDILGGALIGAATGAAFTLGGLAGVGMMGTKAAIIGFGVSTVASFGAGVGANVLQSAFRGEDIDWNEALQDGALTAVESAVCFWVGASMSAGGMWKSLNAKAYSSSIGFFKSVGQGTIRSIANGSLLYFEMFGKELMVRTGVKFLYTYWYSHLRNNN